jgi:hypothetical protein
MTTQSAKMHPMQKTETTQVKNMNSEMMEKIAAYAVRTGKTEDEAKAAFAAWLKDEFGVVDMATEDEYLLNEWAEMFVIETRNLGASGGGGRETTVFLGHICGLNESIRDQRQNQREAAILAFRQDKNKAIDNGTIGIVAAYDGVWNINGKPTKDRVDGELPWYAFLVDGTAITMLNTNKESQSYGKPMASESKVRYMYFLGNTQESFISAPKMWRIALNGDDMTHTYELGQLCRVEVVPSSNADSDILYTNRGFAKTVKYNTDDAIPAQYTDAGRFWTNPEHGSCVNLANLLEEYEDRKVPYNNNFIPPVVLTKGYISRMSVEPTDNQYDDTGRNFRISVTSLELQSTYGRESNLAEVTVWVPGRTFDSTHPFEFNNGEEWVPYAERTQVIICGKVKTRMYREDMVPSITALGIYVPPRTARPGARGGNTDTSQLEE